MFSQIRNSLFSKVFLGLMGLYLFNISVDTPDFNPEYVPENLSLNDQESIVEIVIEKILGYEDAIEEYDDNDNEDHNKKTNVKIDLIVNLTLSAYGSHTNLTNREQIFSDSKAHLTNGFNQLHTPPPRI